MDGLAKNAVPVVIRRLHDHANLYIAAGIAIAGLFGLLLVVRRTVGAINQPLPPVELIVTAFVIGTATWLTRYPFTPGRADALPNRLGGRIGPLILHCGPIVVIVLWMCGCSWPFGRLVDWFVWAPLVIAELFWLRRDGIIRSPSSTFAPPDTSAAIIQSAASTDADDQVMQQLIRRRDETGNDVLTGIASTTLSAGQRSGEVFLSFCPPFDATPQFEFEQVEGPEVRAKIGRLLPHGARIDVKLPAEADNPTRLAFELFVHVDRPCGLGTADGSILTDR